MTTEFILHIILNVLLMIAVIFSYIDRKDCIARKVVFYLFLIMFIGEGIYNYNHFIK